MILGICGGSGAGKTTLLKRLAEHFIEMKPAVFSMDNYYFPREQQQLDHLGELNFDLPTALDRERLISDLRKIRAGEAISLNEYLFNAGTGDERLLTIEPSPLIIIEGLFLFHYTEVAALVDYAIFIEVDPDIQLARRLDRDQHLRGYSPKAIRHQWDYHVTPCFNEFLLPYRHRADFYFCNENEADQEFDRLVAALNSRIV